MQVTERITTSCLEMDPSVKPEPIARSEGKLWAALLFLRGQGGWLAGHEPPPVSPHYVGFRWILALCIQSCVHESLL